MLANTPLGRLGEPEDVARRGTVPLLRRGLVHHRRGAARRRRLGDVGALTWRCENGRRRVVITGPRSGDAARQRRRVDLVEPRSPGESGAGPITQFDSDRFPGQLRLRGEGLRPGAVDRLQGRAPDGPVHAPRAGGRAASGGRLRARHRGGARSRRRGRCDGHRRAEVVRGVRRHAQLRGPDRVNPFSIVQIIPNLGCRLGLHGARDEGPAALGPAPPAPRRTWRSATGSTRSGSAART